MWRIRERNRSRNVNSFIRLYFALRSPLLHSLSTGGRISQKGLVCARRPGGVEHRLADNCLASRIYPFLPYNTSSCPPLRLVLNREDTGCVRNGSKKKGDTPTDVYFTLSYTRKSSFCKGVFLLDCCSLQNLVGKYAGCCATLPLSLLKKSFRKKPTFPTPYNENTNKNLHFPV